MRPVLAEDPFAVDDAGAVDETIQRAERALRRVDRGLAARLVGDVGADEAGRRAELAGERLAVLLVHVRQHRLAAAGDDHARGRGAEPRRAAGNHKDTATQLHRFPLRCPIEPLFASRTRRRRRPLSRLTSPAP